MPGLVRLVPSILFLLTLCAAPSQAGAEPPATVPQPSRQALLAGYAAELRAILARGQAPIIDVEHHWGGKLALAELIDKMDRAGVALTWLGQNEKNGSAHALAASAGHPMRLVPATMHGDGPRWHGRDPALLEELAADVRTGRYFALGEFEARHYVSSTNDRDVHLPVDSPSFETVFRLAEESGLPMLLHHEAEDALLPDLERMLARHPQAKVIWCHVGRNRDRATWTVLPSPAGVRAFLDKYPNLYFDLNQASPGSTHKGTRQVDSVLYDVEPSIGGKKNDARLNDEWRTLLEERSDRFVFGSDVNTGRWGKYARVVENFRWLVLKRLSPEAGARIAYGNAWKLMGGQELP
jgi:predicted TIM-barrel fold metal-dependent hydrolase